MSSGVRKKAVEIEREYGLEVRFQVIRPRGGGSERKYRVFDSKVQFERFFMAKDGICPPLVADWKLGEEGDWVVADDGGVVQIIKRGTLKHPRDKYRNKKVSPRGYARTVVGTFNTNGHYKMDTDFEKHPSRYSFTTNKHASNPTYAIRNRVHLTKRERLFVANLMMFLQQGNGRLESMVFAVKEAGYAASSIHVALERANLLLQQSRIMKLVSEQMVDAAEEIGLTVKFVMEGVVDLATNARREDVRLSALKQAGQYIRMEAPELDLGNQLESGYSGFSGSKQLAGGKSNGESDIDDLESEFADFDEVSKTKMETKQ